MRRVREFAHARPEARDDAVEVRDVVVDAIEMTRPRISLRSICSSTRPAASSSCHRVFMRIRLAPGFGTKVVDVPIPALLSDGLAVSILP